MMAGEIRPLRSVRQVEHGGRSILTAIYDGQKLMVIEPKMAFHRQGLVFTDNPNHRAPFIYPDDPLKRPTSLQGFTDDPRLWKIVDAHIQAIRSDDWSPGPIEVPPE